MDHQVADLVQRLDRLEVQNRRLKRFVAATAMTAIALVLMGQAKVKPKVIEADEIRLRHPSGSMIQIGFDVVAGGPQIQLSKGEQKISMMFVNGSPKLDLTGARNVVGLDASKLHPGLWVQRRDDLMNGPKAHFGFLSSRPYFELNSAEYILTATAGSEAFLQIRDETGSWAVLGNATLTTKSSAETTTTGPGTLTFFDRSGKVRWQAP